MLRGCLYVAGALIACAVGAGEALARIPVPCSGQKLVLVKRLPENVKIQTSHGSVHIDLGYKFDGCAGGKWVGYTAADAPYHNLPEAVLELYVMRAGLKGLPAEPSYLLTLSASWPTWLWMGILGAVGIGTLSRFRAAAAKAPDTFVAAETGMGEGAMRLASTAARVSARPTRPTPSCRM